MAESRILYVNGTAYIGGAEVSLLNLLKKLNRNLFTPVVTVPSEGPLVEKIRILGIEVRTIVTMEFSWLRWPSFIAAAARLAFLIKEEKIDLVHANSIYVAEQSCLAAKLAGVGCICHIRDLAPILGGGAVRALAFRKMVKLIAISDAVKRDLVEKLNVPEDKIIRIYNGVDTREFNPGISGDRFRQEFNLGSRKLVGIIGRLSPEKGHEIFLKGGAPIAKERDDIRLVVVGDSQLGSPNYRQKLENLVRALGIEAKVIFTGFRNDLPQVMAALDIIVVPSLAEPFGRVIVEGMAMEKPVIAANSGAIPELISNECGWLVKPGDIEELESGINYLLKNEGQGRILGKRGRKAAIERFDIDYHVSAIEELYKNLLEKM